MKYVVTGGAGFIGSHISRQLVNNGHEVTIVDNMHRGRQENIADLKGHLSIANVDITDMKAMHATLSGADGIFHQAALTSVPESFVQEHEYRRVNVDGTENVFALAREMDIKTVYASSSSVYGNVRSFPISEDTQRAPANPYGKTKLDDEILAEKYHENGSSIIGLRYFNVYGYGQSGDYAGVITKFLKAINDNMPPTIYGDGSKIRDFVHVDDVAKANLMAMDTGVDFALLNIGTGIETSILDLAQTMIELSGKDLLPTFCDAMDGDIEKSQADTSRAKSIIGWSHTTMLYDGLGRLFAEC